MVEGLFDAVDDDLALFLDRSRRAGVTPLLLDIVADATEPTVVRQRAYGRAAAELAHRQGGLVASARRAVPGNKVGSLGPPGTPPIRSRKEAERCVK